MRESASSAAPRESLAGRATENQQGENICLGFGVEVCPCRQLTHVSAQVFTRGTIPILLHSDRNPTVPLI